MVGHRDRQNRPHRPHPVHYRVISLISAALACRERARSHSALRSFPWLFYAHVFERSQNCTALLYRTAHTLLTLVTIQSCRTLKLEAPCSLTEDPPRSARYFSWWQWSQQNQKVREAQHTSASKKLPRRGRALLRRRARGVRWWRRHRSRTLG